MAASSREQSPDLGQPYLRELLKTRPTAVAFFQAVRLLERIQPERRPVGHFHEPFTEVARFAVHPSLAFPASEVEGITWPENAPPRVEINFFGLTGPQGVLPYPYTEFIVHRLSARDRTARDFVDLFHHRILSLFYRAWQKYRLTVTYQPDGDDQFTQHLFDLVGLGTPGLRKRQQVRDESLAFYAGLVGMQQRSAAAMQHVLEDYFGVPVAIEQFVGRWYDLEPDAQCCLDGRDLPSRVLGVGAVAGDQVWDHQASVRVRIGPLSLARYKDFLPGCPGYNALHALTKFYAGGQLDFDIQLVLARAEVPEYELGADDALPLGLCSWIKVGAFERDPDDATIALGD